MRKHNGPHSNQVGNLPSTAYRNVVSGRQNSWKRISDSKQKTMTCYSGRHVLWVHHTQKHDAEIISRYSLQTPKIRIPHLCKTPIRASGGVENQ